MASIPNSPGRRLVDFLAEKQEPFVLDVFLVENGYCRRSFGSEVGYKKLQKLATQILKRQIAVFVHGIVRKRTSFQRKSSQTGGSGVIRQLCRENCDVDKRVIWEPIELSKQLSPVSVLELHSEESDSPVYEDVEDKRAGSLNSSPQTKAPEINELTISHRRAYKEYRAKTRQMTRLELKESMSKLIQVPTDVEEIALQVEDAIFEDILEECVIQFRFFL